MMLVRREALGTSRQRCSRPWAGHVVGLADGKKDDAPMRLNKSDHGISERFTHVHEREDGSHHVFFAPPPASRPPGWPASYTLPRLCKKRGTLADPKFRDAVVNDAKLLNQQLDA